ncbi:nitrate- and nitrite sensing domain-containing protein, partial [Escherichia coli]
NIYLGAPRPDILPGLDAYSSDAMALQHEVCRWLEPLQHDAGERMRLLDRIAYALHGLDELPGLRRRVRTGGIEVAAATAAFTRLIGGLLNVVFE